MPRSASVSNIFAAMPALERMPTPTALILATASVADQLVEADRRLALLEHGDRLGEAARRHGEGQVARSPLPASLWTIMSTLMFGLGERREDRRDRARLVGHAGQRDPRLVLVVGDAGDELLFHVDLLDLVVGDDHRAGPVLERREDLQRHVVAHGEPDRAGLQHLGADRGQLEHLL